MPIIFPIEDELAGVAPAMSSAGSSLTAAALSVSNLIRGACAGRSAASAALLLAPAGALSLSAAAAASSAAAARLRLNNEPNVDLAGAIASSSAAAATPSMIVGLAGHLGGAGAGGTLVAGTLAVTRAEEFGFTVFLDITGGALAGAGRMRRYDARLTSDGATVPARRIVERAAPSALGVTLDVDLATPDRALVDAASNLEFQIGLWGGTGFDYATLLTGGVRASDTARYGNEGPRPADRVSFGTLDLLGDRWSLAPSAPTTLYDPDKVEAPALPTASNMAYSPGGVSVTPVSTPVFGLTLHEVLNAAYVAGCGFSKVVTNIPDFPVAEVTFSLEGGYHEAVKPLLGLFEPVYFADGDALWIVDADAPLPAGFTPLTLTAEDVQTVEDAGPPRTPTTAIIVELKTSGGDYFTERIETPTPEETGTFGVEGYTRTSIERRVREWRNFDAPTVIVREEEVYEKTTTEDFEFDVTGRKTEARTYDALGRKSGHTLTVESRVPDPDDRATLSLQTVSQETYTIFYRPGPRPGTDEIARTVNQKSGLVLQDNDKPYLGKPYEIPYTQAHKSGYIDPDADQATQFQAISTTIDTYVREGAETQVRRQIISHLNGGTNDDDSSQTRAGTTQVPRRVQGTVRRVVTLDGRMPVAGYVIPVFSAGDIPENIALPLARRKLLRLNNPPRRVTATFPYLELRVRRGTVVSLRARGGYNCGTFIVEGYTRTYEQMDAGVQKFSMTLNARQLTANL